MDITKDNVGDIICRYKDGARLMVTEVNDHIVKYKNETWGGQYITDEHSISGTIDCSLDSVKSFMENQTYITVLEYAESRALMDSICPEQSVNNDPALTLTAILKQKKEFGKKIQNENLDRKPVLINSFLQDFNSFNVGEKITFYGLIIEKPFDEQKIIIDNKLYNIETAKKHLLESDSPLHRHMFTDLIDNAAKRSINTINDKDKTHRMNSSVNHQEFR